MTRAHDGCREPRTETPLVRFEQVSCGYDGAPVLADVDLTIERGAFVGIVGPSGAGKTTLLRAMVGAVPKLRGPGPIAGEQVDRATAHVGWVPQLETVDWNFPATVREVVLMGRWSDVPGDHGRPADTARRRAARAARHRRPGRRHIRELSGGQQQRVFLARAMIGRPGPAAPRRADERRRHQDRDDILHLLADLNRDGMTIVLTTHELNSVAAHLPWVVCVNRRIVAEGDPDAVFTSEILNATYGADLRVVRQGHGARR